MTRDELVARCWQTEGELDRARERVERATRWLDRTPDGSPDKPDAELRVQRALRVYHDAERVAGDAADALIAYDDEHGIDTITGQPKQT